MSKQEPWHDAMCDRDLCHPDCRFRKWATANDRPYPGKNT